MRSVILTLLVISVCANALEIYPGETRRIPLKANDPKRVAFIEELEIALEPVGRGRSATLTVRLGDTGRTLTTYRRTIRIYPVYRYASSVLLSVSTRATSAVRVLRMRTTVGNIAASYSPFHRRPSLSWIANRIAGLTDIIFGYSDSEDWASVLLPIKKQAAYTATTPTQENKAALLDLLNDANPWISEKLDIPNAYRSLSKLLRLTSMLRSAPSPVLEEDEASIE